MTKTTQKGVLFKECGSRYLKLYTEIITPKHIQIWTRKNMNFRKRNFAKQGESELDDWPDVECHRSLAKNINSPKLSHGPPRASKPCCQNIDFSCLSIVRSYIVTRNSFTLFWVFGRHSRSVYHPLAFLLSSRLLSLWKRSGELHCCL